MASLLREQTRVKESLEGALERQKEGIIYLIIVLILCCVLKFNVHVHAPYRYSYEEKVAKIVGFLVNQVSYKWEV